MQAYKESLSVIKVWLMPTSYSCSSTRLTWASLR